MPLIIMVILLITGVFAPLVAPADPYDQSLSFRNLAPTWGRATEYNVVPDPADYDMEVKTSLGWESLKPNNSLAKNEGLTAYLSLTRLF